MSNLNEAIKAIKAGDKVKGQRLLTQFVQINPQDEVAWLWLAVAVEDPSQKRQYLQRVLKINPDNTVAKQGLQQLQATSIATPEMPTLEEIVPGGQANKTSLNLKSLSPRKLSSFGEDTSSERTFHFTVLDLPQSTDQRDEVFILYLRAFLTAMIVAIVIMVLTIIIGGGLDAYSWADTMVFIHTKYQDPKYPLRLSPPEPLLKLFIEYLPSSISQVLPIGLGFGIFIGLTILMVLLFAVSAHIRAVRRRPSGDFKGALSVHQTRTIELGLSYDKVFDLCFEAALTRGNKIHLKDRDQGKIVSSSRPVAGMIYTGRAMVPYIDQGENISFDLERVSSTKTRVRLLSEPIQRTKFLDNGSSLENIETITDFLKLKVQELVE